jgi:hypothetical protein
MRIAWQRLYPPGVIGGYRNVPSGNVSNHGMQVIRMPRRFSIAESQVHLHRPHLLVFGNRIRRYGSYLFTRGNDFAQWSAKTRTPSGGCRRPVASTPFRISKIDRTAMKKCYVLPLRVQIEAKCLAWGEARPITCIDQVQHVVATRAPGQD